MALDSCRGSHHLGRCSHYAVLTTSADCHDSDLCVAMWRRAEGAAGRVLCKGEPQAGTLSRRYEQLHANSQPARSTVCYLAERRRVCLLVFRSKLGIPSDARMHASACAPQRALHSVRTGALRHKTQLATLLDGCVDDVGIALAAFWQLAPRPVYSASFATNLKVASAAFASRGTRCRQSADLGYKCAEKCSQHPIGTARTRIQLAC